MKTPVLQTLNLNPLVPIEVKKEYYTFCDEFGKGFSPRDKDCVRCHLQLLCMSAHKINYFPQKEREIKEELGIKFWLDEGCGDLFEDFYEDIAQAIIGDGGMSKDDARELVKENFIDYLQLSDTRIPEITLMRLCRDERFNCDDHNINVK